MSPKAAYIEKAFEKKLDEEVRNKQVGSLVILLTSEEIRARGGNSNLPVKGFIFEYSGHERGKFVVHPVVRESESDFAFAGKDFTRKIRVNLLERGWVKVNWFNGDMDTRSQYTDVSDGDGDYIVELLSGRLEHRVSHDGFYITTEAMRGMDSTVMSKVFEKATKGMDRVAGTKKASKRVDL